MFTGIVEAAAQVIESTGSRLVIERPSSWNDLKIGSSVSVSGVCLSVIEFDNKSMTFDVVEETRTRTTLDMRTTGRINLERALKADARFEGHIVQGHTEGTAKVENIEEGILTIILPAELQPFVIQKGSIAIDGVSLTVASINENQCSVALIPHTLENTTLGSLKQGDSVNIETDILGKYILSAQQQ